MYTITLALTHANRMLTDLQRLDDVRAYNNPINLSERIEFKSLIPNKVRYQTLNKIKTISNEQIMMAVKKHHDGNDSNVFGCLLIFQMMTGLRVNNCILSTEMLKFYDSVHVHPPDRFCGSESEDCCVKLKVKSKTSDNELVVVPPNAFWCCKMLINMKMDMNRQTFIKEYNRYIRELFGETFHSHDIRRILPNFLDLKQRNTGGWKSYGTMRRHYIAGFTLQRNLYAFIQQFGLNNRSSCCVH